MARFHSPTVTDHHRTIRHAVLVMSKPDTPEAFDFIPGQYLTFRRNFGGHELRRNYSIRVDKSAGTKRADGGAFSIWTNQLLTVGERLQRLAAKNTFDAC